MTLRAYLAVQALCERAWLRIAATSARASRRADDRGQTTAEYALVIVGAATVALLLLTWATGSGKIGELFNKVLDTIADMVT